MGRSQTIAENADTDDDIYQQEIYEREKLVEACPIDVFVSGISRRYGYQHKMMSYNEARPGAADTCSVLMIDSGYRRVGDMAEILYQGEKLGADYIIPPDITPHIDDFDPNPDSCWSRVAELEEYYWAYKNHDYDGKVLAPVQVPFIEHIEELRYFKSDHRNAWRDKDAYDGGESEAHRVNQRGNRPTRTVDMLEVFDGIALGGLRALKPDEVADKLQEVNHIVPQDCHVHALAPGSDMRVLKALRDDPQLVDSLDVSTPETAPANNKMPDNAWKQHIVPFQEGTNISTVRAMRSLEIVHRLNFILSDFCDDSSFESAYRAAMDDRPGTTTQAELDTAMAEAGF